MKQSRLHYLIRERDVAADYKTAVSLHSHTMHSKESTSFVSRLARKSKTFDLFIRSQLKKYSEKYGDETLTDLDAQCARMWWTSPLSARQAYDVEKRQIVDELGLEPIVSITDHDNIDAPLQLQMMVENGRAPISVEWTTPYEETYFHMGVHNLHPSWAPEMMQRMEAFTAAPEKQTLGEMFRELASHPEILIVLNHPYWDQPGRGDRYHEGVLARFIEEYRDSVHALEINGLRSWEENRKVVRLSRDTGIKLISGGDRHGREPNATLNLTNAADFSEFVDELRSGAVSRVCLMPHFHDPLARRIFQGMWDVLSDHPEHARGHVRWAQRVFRRCEDDSVKSFDDFFGGRDPKLMRLWINTARFLVSDRVRPAWQRWSFPSEAAL